ncbi:phage tail protein [Maricaulis maris]|uniref:phage tail protein n=1 Tax=Maricaulis maris TaxID=74318 RepID=UPI0026EE3A6D|nr:tail fiber protein [Maricaulis maris]
MKILTIASASLVAALASLTLPAAASAQEPMLGEIRAFGFNFCPRGWAAADGQIMPVSQYTALFSLYGTMYGGDGRSTFALPDLRGRTMVSQGSGPGLAPVQQGQRIGGQSAASGNGAATTPSLGVQYCVAMLGTYPSRN